MSDVFDDLEINFNFGDPELMKKFFIHALHLEAKVEVLKDLFIGMLAKTGTISEESATQYINKLIEEKSKEVFMNNILTEDGHRNGLIRVCKMNCYEEKYRADMEGSNSAAS